MCALAYVEPGGEPRVFTERCEGELAHEPRGDGGFGYDPAFVPADRDDGRTMAELTRRGEGRDQPPRPRRARVPRVVRGSRMTRGPAGVLNPNPPRKTRAAALSIASNAILIALKLVAGAITGSIAVITEAVHSAIDLLAS